MVEDCQNLTGIITLYNLLRPLQPFLLFGVELGLDLESNGQEATWRRISKT